MSFSIQEHNTASAQLNRTKIETSVWITDCFSRVLQNEVSAVITLNSGAMHLHENLSAEQAQAMIDMLNQHIDYIKAAEIELLAFQTKAAA